MFAIFQGMIELWSPHPIVAGFVCLLLAYIPIVGTVLGFFGAVEGWGMSYWESGLIFFTPLLLLIGIFIGALIVGGNRKDQTNKTRIPQEESFLSLKSIIGKVLLGALVLLTVGLGVLAVVEADVFGENARVYLYLAACALIALGAAGYFKGGVRWICFSLLIGGLGILSTVPVAFSRVENQLNKGKQSSSSLPSPRSTFYIETHGETKAKSVKEIMSEGLEKLYPENQSLLDGYEPEETAYQKYLQESLRASQEREKTNRENEQWRAEQRSIAANREAARVQREQKVRERAIEVLNESDPEQKEMLKKRFESDVRMIRSLPLRNRTVDVANEVGFRFSWQPDWVLDNVSK